MKSQNNAAFLWALFAIGFPLFICWGAAKGIYASWQQEEYSHGYFILPLALWIGAHRLAEKPVAIKSSWVGCALVALSLCFWAVGELSGIMTMPQYALLGLFYGAFLAFYGGGIVKKTWPALAYLFFAIPLPQAAYMSLSAKMQLVSSGLGVFLLHHIGVSVFQDGNIIDLGTYKLQVVEACSGLRYLFPLTSFSFLFAVLLDDVLWKRVTIFLSAIPAAIGFNALRIAVIGIVASLFGTEQAVTITHDIEGWVSFALCIVLLYGEAVMLTRIPPQGRLSDHYFNWPSKPRVGGQVKTDAAVVLTLALLLAASALYGAGILSPKPEIIPLRESFSNFPTAIGGWTGHEELIDSDTLDLLKATDVRDWDFVTPDAKQSVNFFVAYYDSQRNERTFHSPMICLPGSGWKTINQSVRQINLSPRATNALHLNRLIIERGMSRLLVYYWFEQRGVSEPDFYRVKARIIADSITTGRTDGALVRLTTPIDISEQEDDADKRLQNFLGASSEAMQKFIPDYSPAKTDAP